MLTKIKECEPETGLPHRELQLSIIHTEEMMEIKKSPFGKYYINYWRQESLIDAKSMGKNIMKEQNYYIPLYFSTGYLLNDKGKYSTFKVHELGQHLNPVIKVSITSKLKS